MNLISSFSFILRDKKERSYLWAIILGIILITILETFSIATIIPVFNVIIFEKIPENNFFIIENLKLNSNLKILTLCLFFFIFFFKSIIVILFNYFFINFLSRLNIKTSNRLFYLYLKQDYIFFARGNSKNFLNEITDDVYKMNSFLLSLINVSTEIFFVVAISILLIFSNYMIFLFFFSIFFFSILIYFNFFKRRINDWSLLNTESSIKIKNLGTADSNLQASLKNETLILVKNLYSIIDKAVKKKVIHKNTAARKKSRIGLISNRM